MKTNTITNVLILDDLEASSSMLESLLNQLVTKVTVCTTTVLPDLLHYDLLIIQSYCLRGISIASFKSTFEHIPNIVGISSVDLLPLELEAFKEMNIRHNVLLPKVQKYLVDLIVEANFERLSFDLTTLLQLGLEKDEALNTANAAFPKLEQRLEHLNTTYQGLSRIKIVEQLHGLNGLTNYCCLPIAKKLINDLEIDIKESPLEHLSTELAHRLLKALQLTHEHLSLGKEAFNNGLIQA